MAEPVLEANTRTLFEKMMRHASKPDVGSIAELGDANPFLRIAELESFGTPMLSESEIQTYVDAFTKSGFFGPVSWYRNIDRNSELYPGIGTQKLDLPCLMVTAEWDAALPPATADGMPALCSDLERVDIVECGHWTQQEKPAELNEAMIGWLRKKFA